MDMQVLYAGDTSDVWEISHVTSAEGSPIELAELDANYSCRLVANGQGAGAIDRLITDKNAAGTQFLAWLTPAETLALGDGTWRIGIELRNMALVPPLVREVHQVVRIEPGLVPPP